MQLLQGCSCHFQAVRSLGGPFFCPCLSLPGLTLLQPAAAIFTPTLSHCLGCLQPAAQRPPSPLSIEALYAAASGLQLPFSGSA